MEKEFDLLVYIGRFQPFHNGHKTIVDRALSISERVVIVIGSDLSPRTFRNMFTSQERESIIRSCYSEKDNDRLYFIYQMDYPDNNDKWVSSIRKKINDIKYDKWQSGPYRFGLIGHKKDDTKFYLKMFPGWKTVDMPNYKDITGTKIRKFIMNNKIEDIADLVNINVLNTIKLYMRVNQKEFDQVKAWYFHDLAEEEKWKNAPYPVNVVTVDSVVIVGGSILLIKRKYNPGKGLWALPGGHLNTNERIVDGIIRELKEETNIKVPVPVLLGNIKTIKYYDNPNRSTNSRRITHVALIKLENETEYPKVRASDDAEEAKWVPLCDLDPSTFFEDHVHIIYDLMGIQ